MSTRREFLELAAGLAGSIVLAPVAEATGHPPAVRMAESPIDEIAAARAVTARLLGARADEFEFELAAAERRNPYFELTAAGGRVNVRANSAGALCRGVYTYLRQSGQAMVTWSGRRLELPTVLPDCAPITVESPYKFVQYYNVCTFGYSTPFWNWERWEREIDWMALHGINMPLAMEGQEYVWQKVWREMGLSQAELDRFSTGPAHLPWHRMGNIDNFDGPLPQSWIDKKRDLQKRILCRMRELGMSPIVPAFSGFVPRGFTRVFPEARTYTEFWQNSMPRTSLTQLLDPRQAELFKEIGRRFTRAYEQEYGASEFRLADTFNEMSVPLDADRRLEQLAEYGRTVYESVTAGNANATWVLQGWMFRNDPVFWSSETVAAFLSRVPTERVLIIDFSSDSEAEHFKPGDDPTTKNVWKICGAFAGKPWINGMAHTFGGNNNVKGNLALIAAQPAQALRDAGRGNLVGWGMDPEGIENNEVAYELLTDVGWSAKIDLEKWVPAYCRARYGDYPEPMQKAWDLLLKSAYRQYPVWDSRHAWQCRPSLDPKPVAIDAGPVFQEAVDRFLSCYAAFKANPLYRNDLIELAAQAAGGCVDRHLAAACAAHKAGQRQERDRMASEAIEMLLRIDAIMNLRPERRLETWVGDARGWAATPDEAAYLDANARRVLTIWGWNDLNDYASRVWSGLIRDYYVGRWRTFFVGLKETNDDPVLLDKWEEAWLSAPYRPSQAKAVEDLGAEAQAMLRTCREWS